ncbi:MAG: methylated-DNA--[protein]-cysteine S-methyltransferase [candidate division KSB1 bacterium]|nr:methylated-DNA--[protein]-cysteine S-methyltransferase [candidate division KSB1 bacterium]MDZ7318064.1 methylated-DNA--[protein]-cysteine S-methyltransferase [candidate division KSB1 bacterium]MDZ7339757.1 methylated-DNA--[protein]-cysteine S-methyltransferase [candidate division KSB1 bacterium]
MESHLPDAAVMYDALVRKDSRFEGVFFVGVKSTGIFCRPTCHARKPKIENVEFFPSAREALLHGYRPCRLCHPLAYQGDIPAWLRPVIDEVDRRPDLRLRDSDLKKRGLDPNRVRRWFKKNHGMTFQTYLRTRRISQAFGRIKNGEKVIEAAYESGYESLSGFTESFKKATGFSPNQSSQQDIVMVTRILTPLGPMLAGANDEGICLLEFIDRRMLETQLERLRRLLRAELIAGSHRHFELLDQQIKEYFGGIRKEFTVPLVMKGTRFQQRVWTALQRIPYGETRSYKQQAESIGQPTATRAVARANGDNRIAIIIPCHRVIGVDGGLVGYGGGLWRKKFLLDLEARHR